MKRAILVLLVIGYTAQSASYGAVWRSDLTLWAWAAIHAPRKPRPIINLASALMNRGDYGRASVVLDYAAELVTDDAIPLVDTQDAFRAITANQAVVAQMVERR